jgi:ribosomal protein S27AE
METTEKHPHGTCTNCGGEITMIIRRDTRFCCGNCEEEATR